MAAAAAAQLQQQCSPRRWAMGLRAWRPGLRPLCVAPGLPCQGQSMAGTSSMAPTQRQPLTPLAMAPSTSCPMTPTALLSLWQPPGGGPTPSQCRSFLGAWGTMPLRTPSCGLPQRSGAGGPSSTPTMPLTLPTSTTWGALQSPRGRVCWGPGQCRTPPPPQPSPQTLQPMCLAAAAPLPPPPLAAGSAPSSCSTRLGPPLPCSLACAPWAP